MSNFYPDRPDDDRGQGEWGRPRDSGRVNPYGASGDPVASNPYGGPAGHWTQPGQEAPQPKSVHTAVRLMWGVVALALISLVVTLFSLDSLLQATLAGVEQSGQQVTDAMRETMRTVLTAAVVGGSIISAALWLWLAWKNGQGRNWARIVATVLAGLNVLTALPGVIPGSTTTGTLFLGLVRIALMIAILALLWRKESSAFFSARSSRPQPYV